MANFGGVDITVNGEFWVPSRVASPKVTLDRWVASQSARMYAVQSPESVVLVWVSYSAGALSRRDQAGVTWDHPAATRTRCHN